MESLNKEKLWKAQRILEALYELSIDLEKERSKENLNEDTIFELLDLTNEKSSLYYEIIPCIKYRTEPFPPLESIQEIRQ